MTFRDRADAGRQLAGRLRGLELEHPVVEAMARGGVPVGYQIARVLRAPLDVIVVRKLGHPSQPELGLGALAEGGVRVVNTRLVSQLQVGEEVIDRVASLEEIELGRRLAAYRGDRHPVEVTGRTVVVVDDGLATGFTALAAIEAMRRRGASRVVLAVPVAPPGALSMMHSAADDVVCLEATERFFGISEWYGDFRQVPDEEVVALLASAHHARRDFELSTGGQTLRGELAVPPEAQGLVLFAHGSGSSRLSPRNRSVAGVLEDARLATLLFDLLSEEEAVERANVFDVGLLASRMEDAVARARGEPGLADLRLGFFGASTGAAAALVAASRLGDGVSAVVSRGGRPDLAGAQALRDVSAPTLLIVGGRDDTVLELNRRARAELGGESRLDVVAGATHLFEEPGTLERVAELATEWFVTHLARERRP
jgi:putative phosphoribosyl transferase